MHLMERFRKGLAMWEERKFQKVAKKKCICDYSKERWITGFLSSRAELPTWLRALFRTGWLWPQQLPQRHSSCTGSWTAEWLRNGDPLKAKRLLAFESCSWLVHYLIPIFLEWRHGLAKINQKQIKSTQIKHSLLCACLTISQAL